MVPVKVRVLRRAGLRVVASALLAPWMAHRNGLWIFGRGFGWWAGVMLIAVSAPALSEGESKAASRDVPSVRQPAAASSAATSGAPLQLKVRRLSDVLEVVVEGTGPAPQLQQSQRGAAWLGHLTTATPKGVMIGVQRFSLPEAGLQSVSLDGAGTSFQLDVVPMAGMPMARPVVSADGQNLILSFPLSNQVIGQIRRPNVSQPGAIPLPSFAPPLQSRATAPPLGDMAVGSMVLRNQSFVNVTGPRVTLTLRNAPAKDALMAIAQLGRYGFVFVDNDSAAGGNQAPGQQVAVPGQANSAATPSSGRLVTLAFRDEDYSRALNSVLLASGLQGKREGNMILAGPNVLGKSFGPQWSKVYRLNQASAASAADYLASLGASISKVNVITATTSSSDTTGTASSSASNTTGLTESITAVETYGATTGPLKGLSGTTDSRLQTITLIGDSSLVAVAESYLKQLDLRQRQVALSVKILDVNLTNDVDIQNSFAFKSGNTFIVSDRGTLLGYFGSNPPPNEAVARTIAGGASSSKAEYKELTEGSTEIMKEPLAPAPVSPGKAYQDGFYDFLRAQIQSSSTKLLANPTLILSENSDAISGGQEVATGAGSALATATIGRPFANESFVTVGTQVITNYTVQAGQNGAPNSCQPAFGTAGLTFGARVSKIDDNGFVTFSLSPSVSATTSAQNVEGCGPINILSVRRLDTGTVRVRDGQTLILTGVISDADNQVVTKWPILGDLPIVGQFFRNTGGSRQKRELVIMVTPSIIDDSQGGSYGYGYRPISTEAQRMMSGSM
jgi:type IV pilus assembly protein PilQ